MVDASRYVDIDADETLLENPADATSLMFMLSMEHGAVQVSRSPEGSTVRVADRTFTGADDLAALREAWVVLGRTEE